MRQPCVVEARRRGDRVEAGEFGLAVGLGGELAGGVAGADAQFQHHRGVGRLRQLEALLHHAHDGRQVGARVDEPHRRLERIGIGALLDDAGALAVILAEDDHGAAHHAGRGQVGERVGRHIGADDRFPGHRPAQRVIDGGAEHGGRRGLVGAGLQVHPQLAHNVLGVDQHVEQMGHRGALVAADIGYAGLQQRLGDGEDAFATEGLAVAQFERLHFLLKGAFHRVLPPMV